MKPKHIFSNSTSLKTKKKLIYSLYISYIKRDAAPSPATVYKYQRTEPILTILKSPRTLTDLLDILFLHTYVEKFPKEVETVVPIRSV